MKARKKPAIDSTAPSVSSGQRDNHLLYEWQHAQWQQLWQAHKAERLPHALLFAGIIGTGKALFADIFANTLLCTQVDAEGMPCRSCHACRMLAGDAHPSK